MQTEATVFIASQDVDLCAKLAGMLAGDPWAFEQFASGEELLARCNHSLHAASCLLLESRLTDMTAVNLFDRLIQSDAMMPVIFVAPKGSVQEAVKVMKQGAVDYISDMSDPQEFRASIRKAIAICRERQEQLAEQEAFEQRLATLSDAERMVLQLVVSGSVNRDIAEKLDVSLRTVQYRRSSIMKKLQIGSWIALLQLPSLHDLRWDPSESTIELPEIPPPWSQRSTKD